MFIYEKLFDYKKSLVYEKNESNPFLLTGKKCFAVLFATFRTVMTALPLTVGANNPVICAIKTNRFQNLGNSESSLWGCAIFFIMPVTNSLRKSRNGSFTPVVCILRRHAFTHDTERNHKKNGHHHYLVLYFTLYIAVLHIACRHHP